MVKNFLFNKQKNILMKMFLSIIKYESVLRWGFAGMPASHGVTKSHRRPGHIGSGKHFKLYLFIFRGVYFL